MSLHKECCGVDEAGGALVPAMLILAVMVVVVGVVAWALTPPPIEQPIAFNHRLHVEDLGSGCTDCHLYAETGERATIPNIELCSDCHAEAQTDSPQEAKLVEHIEAGKPVAWQKIYRVDGHVFFSHRRHTSIAGIECATCHGEMGTRETPMERPSVRLTMDYCMDCHYETGASNDCLHCHR